MSDSIDEYSGGVEVVAAPIIANKSGEILLIQSPKWDNRWLVPGGHVDPGETVFEAAAREGEEETGLKLEPKELVNAGELINDPGFARRAHLIFFHIWCEVIGGELKPESREVSDAKWFKIDEAIEVMPPGNSTKNSLLNFKHKRYIDFNQEVYD